MLVYSPNHYLSQKSGFVYEHRLVIYSEYGKEIPPCEFCGQESDWLSRATHIDHIDEVRGNNERSNLRVLCNSCNVTRTKRVAHETKGNAKLTFFGESKTPQEWGRDPRISVSGSCVRHRLRKGMSIADALLSKKITHNGNVPKKKAAPPRHTRKNSTAISINGVSLTASEWSRHPDCLVTDGTIRNRLKRNVPHRECVFG